MSCNSKNLQVLTQANKKIIILILCVDLKCLSHKTFPEMFINLFV